MLHNVFIEIFETGKLPPTIRHGIIVLIPKLGKDPQIFENKSPTTLRNSDYKLLPTFSQHVFRREFQILLQKHNRILERKINS